MNLFKLIVKGLVDALSIILGIGVVTTVIFFVYVLGYRVGYNNAVVASQIEVNNLLEALNRSVSSENEEVTVANPTNAPVANQQAKPNFNWTGPQLWDAVNKRRKELGVNAMSNQSELCTIASIRLNELIELGKLDGHEGFANLPERRPDLQWIFDKYNVSEFLVYGAESATEAVSLWENTLGHKILLTGGEYVWGCTYAQNGFGVAIAAY